MWRYVKYIEDNFIYAPGIKDNALPKKILILGAGGFTMGLGDEINDYTFVDINPQIKEFAEQEFLKQKLSKNKKFVPVGARIFLNQDNNKYDLIIVDAFSNPKTIPPQLLTVEFYKRIKDHLKDDGTVALNFVISPSLRDASSVKIDNTLRTVFYPLVRQAQWVEGNYYLKDKKSPVVYSYFHASHEKFDNDGVYTDNKNTYFRDR